MKVYLYYSTYGDTKYSLFGITNMKKYAKKFEKIHNMDVIKKDVVDMDNEEYAKICNDEHSCIIGRYPLITSMIKDGKYQTTDYYIYCTEMEKLYSEPECGNVDILDENYWTTINPNPNIFNKSIRKILNTLLYDWLYIVFNSSYAKEDEEYDIDMSQPLEIDELCMFVREFKEILKE